MPWSKVVAFRGLGSGRAPIVAKLIVGARGTAATDVVPRYFDGKWHGAEVCQAFRVRGLGLG